MSQTKKGSSKYRSIVIWTGSLLGLLAFLAVIIAGGETVYVRMYEGRMFPGIEILGVDVTGLTKDQARQNVQANIDRVLANGLPFSFRGKNIQVDVTNSTTDPDTARDFISYDIGPALDHAYALGRRQGTVISVLEQIRVRLHTQRLSGRVTVDEKRLTQALQQELHDSLRPAEDARFAITATSGTQPVIAVIPEKRGSSLNMKGVFEIVQRQAQALSFKTISLTEDSLEPNVYERQLHPLITEVQAILAKPNLVFTYDGVSYPVSKEVLASWLTPVESQGALRIEIDPTRFLMSLRSLAPNIERETKNGNLVIVDGKISAFTPGTQGIAINAGDTLKAVTRDWSVSTSTFPLVADVTSGSLLGADPERLGIKELIGVGRSNFSGSPSNRRKNIRLGAEKVNGVIIPPGGEFSLLKTLGVIDGANGWLPELVIKGDKTTPEFGGGLCQIGTTTFRAALDSGLKITQRQNHSYRVRYYEPAGTDATIYDPAPDFRFVNDTDHSVLIHAYLDGDNAIFEFWGTKDGRKADPIKPRIYNIVAPPPMKTIETLDLPVGKKKCTETAHAGADAEFTYNVTYADGSKASQVFTSHYRPWQAVCLVGVEKLSTSPEQNVSEPALAP